MAIVTENNNSKYVGEFSRDLRVPPAAVWDGGVPAGVTRKGRTVRNVRVEHRTDEHLLRSRAPKSNLSNAVTASAGRPEEAAGALESAIVCPTPLSRVRDLGVGLIFGLLIFGSFLGGTANDYSQGDVAQFSSVAAAR